LEEHCSCFLSTFAIAFDLVSHFCDFFYKKNEEILRYVEEEKVREHLVTALMFSKHVIHQFVYYSRVLQMEANNIEAFVELLQK
jgi:hypothetical protein